MPCYEVRTMSVEFKAENRQLLDAAIRNSNILVTGKNEGVIEFAYGKIVLNTNTGIAEVQDRYQSKLNEIKRNYSKECIKAAAKKMQWNVKMAGYQATISKLQW